MRVLIVEDSRVGQLLRAVMKRDGHEPVLAEDGENGWTMLSQAPAPDLVVLDRMLPDMDGADLLDRLRADARTAELPVLVVTASAQASAHLDDGVRTRVLGKPFDLGELRALMASLTDH
ncbi:response regulator [Actinomadura madurae]|uniref:response regulator n=1 Tax=Actinomadura madurae TaxID=1993 RepID=UPI0020D23591|nr:response regulator [Actinomadura madurae]